MLALDHIYNMDCLEGMKMIPDNSIDCIICDLPYGTTACAWDSIIPFDKLWEQYHRVSKPNAPIVLFGSEPFSTMLRMSNLKDWRYDWIWDKDKGSGFANANKMPLKAHEIISVFYGKLPTYNPQKEVGRPYHCSAHVRLKNNEALSARTLSEEEKADISKVKSRANIAAVYQTETKNNGDRFPTSVLRFPREFNGFHPTQKPVNLLRYLIATYSNEGDTILDNCMGSGTTAIACIKEQRHYIGFELNEEYYKNALKRIEAETIQGTLF